MNQLAVTLEKINELFSDASYISVGEDGIIENSYFWKKNFDLRPVGVLGCPKYLTRLLQTFPPVWEPRVKGIAVDGETLFIKANILEKGHIYYPLGKYSVELVDCEHHITLIRKGI